MLRWQHGKGTEISVVSKTGRRDTRKSQHFLDGVYYFFLVFSLPELHYSQLIFIRERDETGTDEKERERERDKHTQYQKFLQCAGCQAQTWIMHMKRQPTIQ